MSIPPTTTKEQSTSVFNALGSYADRIRDAKATSSKPNDPTPSSKPNNNASPAPNGSSHTSSKISSTSTSSMSKLGRGSDKDKVEEKQPVTAVKEEQWETVQVGRSRSKAEKEDKRGNGGGSNNASGSNSRNWRDRPTRENRDKERNEDDKRSNKVVKKGSSSVPPPTSTERIPKPTTTPSGPTKPAWGQSTPVVQQQATIPPSHTTPGSTTSTSIQTPKTNNTLPPTRSRTEPPSPSLNGTTITAGSASLASPNHSADVSGTSTAATSVVGKGDVDVEDWSRSEDVAPPTSAIKQPAPPPAVNPWEARKKALKPTIPPSSTPGAINGHSNPTPAQVQNHAAAKTPISNGNTSSGLPNGDGFQARMTEGEKGGKKKKKASSEPSSAILGLGGKELWPDVGQAAEAAKKEEEKRVVKEKKDSEEGSVAETSTAGPKKTKWVNIPAEELQAAVDEAERIAAIRRKAAKDAAASPLKAKAPRKAISVDGRKGRSASINADVRIPPVPRVPVIPQANPIHPINNANGGFAQIPTYKPTFGTVRAESISTSDNTSDQASEITKTDAIPTGTAATSASAPLSRTTSRQSRSGSKTQVSSPVGPSVPLDPTAAKFTSTNPNLSIPNTNNATQAIPPFQGLPTRSHRGGRLSFNRGGGRGPFRGGIPKGAFVGSPPSGYINGLPGGEMYQRGFGGFMGPAQGQGQSQGQGQGMYMMGGAVGVGMDGFGQGSGFGLQRGIVPPPPPMPQTMVAGLDGLRFYVLGQVEYYFSMQNLAMDFFLRQQMDSEGWIDISMVASFNRVKSLTPDVEIVKECMILSTLLEVLDDKVRLSGGESHKWVLPDAKPTTVVAPVINHEAKNTHTSESGEITSDQGGAGGGGLGGGVGGVSVDEEMNSEIEDVMSSMGMVGTGVLQRYAPGEVENALMKNGSGVGGALGLGLGLGLGTGQEKDKDSGKEGGQGMAEGQGLPDGLDVVKEAQGGKERGKEDQAEVGEPKVEKVVEGEAVDGR